MRKLIKYFKIPLIILVSLILIHLLIKIIPYRDLKEFKKKPYSIHILDRNSNNLRVMPLDNGSRREYLSAKEIPFLVKKIFITSEDKRFYLHYGIDPVALIRSAFLNTKYKYTVSGASTITMQLARIISPHNGGYLGKIEEAVNAIRLEAKLSKKEILELWLNSMPFGNQAIGIKTASKVYFGKDIEELSPAQVLALSVIPRSPVKYNTFDKKENLIEATKRLAKRINYKISDEEIKSGALSTREYQWPFEAPHFVNFITRDLGEDRLKTGKPLKSSLDLELNRFIQEKIRVSLDAYKNFRLTNGSAVVINNKTGEVLAYVGSQGFDDKENSGEIDGVHVLNQPGSAIKPFLYALGLEKGFLPSTILPDIPLDFGGENIYVPMNFNLRYNGPVRLRVALASSLNVCSVYIITRIGVKNFIEKLLQLDFNSIENQKDALGSGLAVGNAEVSLYEIARAFSVFSRGGKKITLTYEAKSDNYYIDGERIYSDYTSAVICNILSDNASRSLGFGTGSLLNTPFPAIFKTGTSNQFGNIWALGATPDYTVGVWIGNFSGNTVIGRTGSSVPASIVVQILKILTKVPKEFDMPENVEKVVICPLSGEKAKDICPGAIYEYFPKGTELKECEFHTISNGKLVVNYPAIFSSWAASNGGDRASLISEKDIKFPRILKPNDGAAYYFDPTIDPDEQVVKVEVLNKDTKEILSLFVNGKKVRQLTYPYDFHFALRRGEWELKVTGRENFDKIKISVE